MSRKNIIAVELYAGAGGMALGAQMAGVDVKLAVEINRQAAKTYAHNHKNTDVIIKDVKDVKEIEINKEDNVSILFGGPPCQGFSLSNQRNRNSGNQKNWLFKEFVRLTQNWKPDWVIIENVSGLLLTEKGIFLKMILDELKSMGYVCTYKLLNAVEYGVPQKRERLFIVGSLNGIEFVFPEKLSKKVTVREAIIDLPELENGSQFDSLDYKDNPNSDYAREMRNGAKFSINNYVTKNNDLVIERYRHIPQGKNWASIPDELMSNYKDKSRCHGGIYYRLKEDEPSVVIGNYRKNMLIHPVQNRGLSVREAARIQSFPDWFEFKGAFTEQQQQVGDAVPPLLAKAIFNQIINLSKEI